MTWFILACNVVTIAANVVTVIILSRSSRKIAQMRSK